MSLKEQTKEKHSLAERHEINRILMSGEITSVVYAEYLKYLFAVFSTIENNFGVAHSDMFRTEKVENDLADLGEYNTVSELVSVKKYCDYLKDLETFKINPHIYLNYMALIFGGQMIKQKVPGYGSVYDFDNKEKIIAFVRSIQQDDWAEEVNRGFDFTISIMDEIYEKHYQA